MTGNRHHPGVLLCLVGFLLLAPLTAWAQQPKSGGTLQVAWEADVAGFDPRLSRVLDTRAWNNTLNHDDKQVDALIDRMKEAPAEAALLQAGYDFQRYITESMMTCGIASLPFLQASRADVKGYVHLHGYKVHFETTWLDKP